MKIGEIIAAEEKMINNLANKLFYFSNDEMDIFLKKVKDRRLELKRIVRKQAVRTKK